MLYDTARGVFSLWIGRTRTHIDDRVPDFMRDGYNRGLEFAHLGAAYLVKVPIH